MFKVKCKTNVKENTTIMFKWNKEQHWPLEMDSTHLSWYLICHSL